MFVECFLLSLMLLFLGCCCDCLLLLLVSVVFQWFCLLFPICRGSLMLAIVCCLLLVVVVVAVVLFAVRCRFWLLLVAGRCLSMFVTGFVC